MSWLRQAKHAGKRGAGRSLMKAVRTSWILEHETEHVAALIVPKRDRSGVSKPV